MTIGDKIIREIGRAALFQTLDHDGQEIKSGLIYVWQSCAVEQLEAVVEAHIEERVRIRLELDREKIFNRSIELVMNEWGKTRTEALDWLSRDEEWR